MAGRLTQEPVEGVVLPDDANGRLSQDIVESSVSSSAHARDSQVLSEIAVASAMSVRFSQGAIEVVVRPPGNRGGGFFSVLAGY
jgi:hypothetical protein